MSGEAKRTREGPTMPTRVDDLATRVEERLAKGSPDAAKREFTRNWRAAVPDLPLRFSVILVRVKEKEVREVLRKRRENDGTPPQLRLDFDEEGRIKVRMARGAKLRLGDIPASDADLLAQLGKKARRLYRPHLLEVRHDDETGRLEYVAVELVRAESLEDEEVADRLAFQEAVEQIAAVGAPAEGSDPDEDRFFLPD